MEDKFYENIPTWSEEELKIIAEKHLMFLTYVHPFLKEKGYKKGVAEIRPIARDEELPYVESFNVFRVDEDTKERYIKWLKKINNKPYCLYYSLYNFDNKIIIKGKKKTKINKENAVSIGVLAIDFDEITAEKFLEIKEIFNGLNISTLDIFSGHGVQCLILLQQMCYDTSLLKRWTTLLVRKGIPADCKIVDCARVFRVPFSFNCKSFDRDNNYYQIGQKPVAIPTTIMNKPLARYNINYIFNKINELPDVLPALDNENMEIKQANEIMLTEKIETEEEKEQSKEARIKQKLQIKKVNEDEVRDIYKGFLNVKNLPLAIIKMLNNTPEGVRNATMLFLIPFLKNMGYTVENIEEIMKIWANRCTPRITEIEIKREVKRLVKYNIKGYAYTKELANTFGYIDLKLQRENKVKIQNQVTNNLEYIADGAFKIFVALLNYKTLNAEIKNYTTEEICRIEKINRKTFYNNINELTSNFILTKNTKVCKKNKQKYVYYINPYLSDFNGFTLLERATIEIMLLKLTSPEIKLYVLMCSMVYKNENIWAGQKFLANKLGKKQTTVCGLLKSLEKKNFISKKIEKHGLIQNLIYNLNY